MRSRKPHLARTLAWTIFMALLAPVSAYAQDLIVEPELLEDWYYSRLVWGVVIGFIAGALVGAFYLSQLKFPHNALHINGLARKKFGGGLFVLFILGGILLLIDAWMLFPFDTTSLTFSEALLQVWLNYRTILILAVTMGAFSIAVAVTTRLMPGSHCPYAFLPGPRTR